MRERSPRMAEMKENKLIRNWLSRILPHLWGSTCHVNKSIVGPRRMHSFSRMENKQRGRAAERVSEAGTCHRHLTTCSHEAGACAAGHPTGWTTDRRWPTASAGLPATRTDPERGAATTCSYMMTLERNTAVLGNASGKALTYLHYSDKQTVNICVEGWGLDWLEPFNFCCCLGRLSFYEVFVLTCLWRFKHGALYNEQASLFWSRHSRSLLFFF